jgi:4-alpha-glucanotransferase
MQALLTALEVADGLFPTYIDELSDDERDCFAELLLLLSLKTDYPQFVNEDGSFDFAAYQAQQRKWLRRQARWAAFIHATKNEAYAAIHKRISPRYSKKAIKAERKAKAAAELKRRQEAGQTE